MNMKIENQVVSLELAQKMKELGFGQESLFYWVEEDIGERFEILYKNEILALNENGIFLVEPYYSAYTVAELGEMLKSIIDYPFENTILDCYCKDEKNEANARAKMLIYLKKNNLI